MTSSSVGPASNTHDVIVVGAGPGGEDATTALLRAGLSVAMVESELVGGECFNWACVPSKAMLRAGHALRSAHRLPGAHEVISGPLQAAAVLAHRDEVISHRDDSGLVEGFTGAGATFVRGHGRLDGPRRVVVETADGRLVLTATLAVIVATGSTVAFPDVPGLAQAGPWTNREATSARRAPRRLTVLGSGAVALELAQAWRSLGSERVVVLSRRATLLPDLEPFAGELVLEGLRDSGVDVRFGVRVLRVDRSAAGGEVAVQLDDGTALVSDELLVATGKRPTTQDLGLEAAGLRPGEIVEVDDSMRVPGSDWLYAIGDVNGRALFTHQASYHARVAAAAIAARSQGAEPDFLAEADSYAVPRVLFTDPEVASVGLSHAQAVGRGIRARVVEADLGKVLGAQLHADGYRGRVSLVVDQDASVLVGATFVGQDVADMVHAASVAVVGRVPLERLRHVIPSFPTMSEVWLDLVPSAS
ncbi:dihydrolipoyl dehydrogenase family protein [Modestobacter versicolor]|uniref:Dihydrolipoamide dehydrogenase n=1 Tax=Modestobacter versicolor TaxID=429133 RepID=A0A323VEV2_9ACTN|nr:NAD(P)/FAD-dependent oxidoreductase [Modestobacter versicolor]MBB3674662.1 dihydrolipoamide dehydrogenase [Modestobacter versicolor]PZA23267.1 pyridine nucleotide-disulfide oxidoreductase [Modestobacter versicolor]